MSLIDEALKRARMEAAKKAADKQGLPYPAIPRHLGGRRRRTAWVAAAVAALAVGLGVAAGLILAGGRRPADRPTVEARLVEPEPRPPAPTASAPSAEQTGAVTKVTGPAPEPEPQAGVTKSEPDAAATAGRPALPQSQVPEAAEAAPATIPAPRGPEPESSARGPIAPPAAPEPTATGAPQRSTMLVNDPESDVLLVLPQEPPSTAGAEPAESYVGEFAAPSGATIELGGIAWSETGPYALINGRVVGPGGRVEGFTVERIGPQHVDLSGAGRRIRISLQ